MDHYDPTDGAHPGSVFLGGPWAKDVKTCEKTLALEVASGVLAGNGEILGTQHRPGTWNTDRPYALDLLDSPPSGDECGL